MSPDTSPKAGDWLTHVLLVSAGYRDGSVEQQRAKMTTQVNIDWLI